MQNNEINVEDFLKSFAHNISSVMTSRPGNIVITFHLYLYTIIIYYYNNRYPAAVIVV